MRGNVDQGILNGDVTLMTGFDPLLTDKDLPKFIQALKKKGIEPYGLDVLIGGPPCQGFSQMRRNEDRDNHSVARFTGYSKLAEDKRNDLVLRFLEMSFDRNL